MSISRAKGLTKRGTFTNRSVSKSFTFDTGQTRKQR